jgi:hypothetical protein
LVFLEQSIQLLEAWNIVMQLLFCRCKHQKIKMHFQSCWTKMHFRRTQHYPIYLPKTAGPLSWSGSNRTSVAGLTDEEEKKDESWKKSA